MARVRSHCNCSRAAALIWTSSALLFILILRATMRNSVPSDADLFAGAAVLRSERRSWLYDKMARDLDEHGAKFLRGGETSQSLSLSDIFDRRDGVVTPRLKAADPPVRATVLYLSTEFSEPLSQTVRDIFLPYFSGVIWFQNTSLYHFSMFHASHHITPIMATDDELRRMLSKVTLGTDPLTIRAKLRNALPHAPKNQLYDQVMLHTSFARLLGHPKIPAEGVKEPSDQMDFFHKLVTQINNKIHGFQATVSEIWFVEEYDVLALALNGRMKARRFHLDCTGN